MGNPMWSYKACLQSFAYYLTCHNDMMLANQLQEENSIEKLEDFILDKEKTISSKEFFYNAGMSCMYVLMNEVNNGGCDSLNAAIGGLTSFEHFIGIIDDEDE